MPKSTFSPRYTKGQNTCADFLRGVDVLNFKIVRLSDKFGNLHKFIKGEVLQNE